MKLTKHQLAGLWFLSGTLISVLVEFIRLYEPSSSFLSIVIGLISAAAASYYLGYHYGYLIIELPDWHICNWFKTLVYGWVISIATLYWIVFLLALSSFLQTEFMQRLADHQYWKIVFQLLFLPFFSLLATIIGCVLEPILILGVSALGALSLFLLRKYVIRLAQ